MSELRENIPPLLDRQSVDIEAPVFFAGGQVPCYAPDWASDDEYVDARDSDYDFW